MRLVRGECLATVGAVSNPDQKNINIGKAGRNRWLGRRPHQRGISMNRSITRMVDGQMVGYTGVLRQVYRLKDIKHAPIKRLTIYYSSS